MEIHEKKPKKILKTIQKTKTLSSSEVDEIDKIDKNARPYQKECLKILYNSFKNNEYCQGIINWPPGLGKTRIGINIVKAFFIHNENCNILWISHRKNIVQSQLKQFDDLGVKYIVYNELTSQEFKMLKHVTRHVIIILRQSLVKIEDISVTLPKIFGLIHDECHDATSSKNAEHETTYKQLVKFTEVKFRIGMSGTPVTLNKFQNDGLLKLYGIDNKINYISSITLFDGVTMGYLLKPKICYRYLNAENNKFNVKDIANELCVLFNEESTKFKYFKGLVWVNSIFDVNQLYDILKQNNFFNQAGELITIYKSTSKYNKNDDIFTNAESNCVMIACDKFTIGYDGSNIEFCVNFRLGEDGGISMQKLGRVSRQKENKDVTHGIMYQYYTENNVDSLTNNIIEAIVRNFENISNIIPMLLKIKKENILDEIKNIPEFKNIDMFLECIEYDKSNKDLPTEITYEKLLFDFVQKIKLSNSDVKLIENANQLTKWIEQYKKYPTKDSNTKNKQVIKAEGENEHAVLMESVKTRYEKLQQKENKDEFTKLALKVCESVPGWIPPKITKEKQIEIYSQYVNVHNIKYSKILHGIINAIKSEITFSREIRNSFGKELNNFSNTNNHVTTLDILNEILNREYAVNPNEQIKILYYCNLLLNALKTTITTKENEDVGENENCDDIEEDIEKDKMESDDEDETIKKYLKKVRLDQSKYRKCLFDKYGSKCMITCVNNKKVLESCHIKPHSECTKKEKYDVNNGLIFRADIHILFDDYKFAINPLTLEIISNINDNYYNKLFKEKTLKTNVGTDTRKYLQIHFDEYIKRNEKKLKNNIICNSH